MNKIIKLVIKYQETNEDEIFQEIIDNLNTLIKKHLNKVEKQNTEDLRQDIIIKIYSIIKSFKINKSLILDDEINDNNSIVIIYEDKKYKFIISYIEGFINKYDEIYLHEAFINKTKFELFLDEYILFNNENQLYRYFEKSFNTIILKYYNNLNKEQMITYSLNNINEYGEEYLHMLEDKTKVNLDFELLDNVEKKIIQLLLQNYTEKDIGKILGFTQQNVNKRKKTIIKKLNIK